MYRSRNLFFLLSLALLAAAALAVGAEEHSYVGTKSCRKCHLKEWKSWSLTQMAKAYDSLMPGVAADAKTSAGLDPQKDYTKDETCIHCHVTGYGKPGGFVDIETTPDLVGVGCEMCHGPGGTYTQDEHMSLKNREYKKADVVAAGLVGEITAEQCKVCHNSESPFVTEGYVFDFPEMKSKGMHEVYPLKYTH